MKLGLFICLNLLVGCSSMCKSNCSLLPGEWRSQGNESEWGRHVLYLEFNKGNSIIQSSHFVEADETIIRKGNYRVLGEKIEITFNKDFYSEDGSIVESDQASQIVLCRYEVDDEKNVLRISLGDDPYQYVLTRTENGIEKGDWN